MLASAIAAFLLFVLEAVFSTKSIPFADWSNPLVAQRLFVLLMFAVRDILFLQWCTLKGFRQPIVKGMLFLLLYYITAFTIGGLFFRFGLAWFTPVGAFAGPESAGAISIFGGAVLQIVVSVYYLLSSIRQSLSPSISSATASG